LVSAKAAVAVARERARDAKIFFSMVCSFLVLI